MHPHPSFWNCHKLVRLGFFHPELGKKTYILVLGTKVPDAYSGRPIYAILQGIQLELRSGRTRSDRPSSVFARANKSYSYFCKHILRDEGSVLCSCIDALMQ